MKAQRILPPVPSVQRVSSMITSDSVADLMNELVEIEGSDSPQKTQRGVSPSPNLEYRSYTPTYEEELLKYRKTSRGMSLENLNKMDKEKDAEIESTSENNQDNACIDINRHNEGISEFDSKKCGSEANMHFPQRDNNIETNRLPSMESLHHEAIPNLQKAKPVESRPSQNETKDSDDPTCPSGKSTGVFQLKMQAIMAFLNRLNLDSRQQDGSATEDVDANMEEFLRVPFRIEVLMSFGILICADSFLHVLTVTPLKFIWSCVCLLCTILNPGKGIGMCRFHRRHLYQFVRVFVIYAVYRYCLSPISIGKLVSGHNVTLNYELY